MKMIELISPVKTLTCDSRRRASSYGNSSTPILSQFPTCSAAAGTPLALSWTR
jgi:hypothetical protein